MAPRHRIWALLAVLPALALGARDAAAAASAPGVSVEMISSPTLTLDSNRPCTDGPRAAYVAFRVTNVTGGGLRDLNASISGFAGGIALQGGQAATQYIGALAAGQSRVVYWFVSYPCTFGISAVLSVAVTDRTDGSTVGSGTVSTASMISAQAGGVLMSGLLGPGAVVGQTIHLDVRYEFGGADVGTTYNLQAVGNTSFNAGCFQLNGSVVLSSSVTAIPAGAANQSYFVATSRQAGTGYQVTIRYYFKYLCAGVTSSARPYSNQLSGTQLKYSSNYETFVGPSLPAATIGFTVAKSASPTELPTGGTATYTVTLRNTSAFTAEVDSIADQLPAGVTYGGIAAGSGVTVANSGSSPAAGATGRLVWRGPYTVPAGASLRLIYTTTVPAADGSYTNTAYGYAGVTLLGSASATVVVGVVYSVGVTPDGLSEAVPRVAGTGYSQAFTVTNGSNVSTGFDLLAGTTEGAGVVAMVDSVTGPGAAATTRPDSVRVSMTVSQSSSFTVWYTVPAGSADAGTVRLRARSAARPEVQDEGWAELRRVAPAVVLAKGVSPTGSVAPGTELTYTLQFQNAGEAAAQAVVVTELLSGETQFRVGSVSSTLPTGVTAAAEYSADGGASWSHLPTSQACGAPTGYDGCVQMIRWTLSGSLPPDSVQSAGTLRFLARVR